MGHNRRKCNDWIEAYFQYGVFSGFIIGMLMSRVEYGPVTTNTRRYRCGFKYACIISFASIPYTYFTCAVCQWPNRGEM